MNILSNIGSLKYFEYMDHYKPILDIAKSIINFSNIPNIHLINLNKFKFYRDTYIITLIN